MYFYEVDECEICPFNPENCSESGSEFRCSRNPDYSLPCHFMEKYGDLTLEEVVKEVNKKIYAAELAFEKELEAKREAKDKAKRAKEARERTKRMNASLNARISSLRKEIRSIDELISDCEMYSNAVSFANQVMHESNNRVESIMTTVMQYKEVRDKKERMLNELVAERNIINKERRKKNKS